MQYFGLYRGFVVNNDDSDLDEGKKQLGRIQISVPEVYGEPDDVTVLPWAWPCTPAFGGGIYNSEKGEVDNNAAESDTNFASGMIAIPSIGATVWVMFEQGDPQSPVWMGTWNGKAAEIPNAAKRDRDYTAEAEQYPNIFIIKTPWGKDMFLRAISNRVLELRFDDMHVQLKAESSPGADDSEIYLWSTDANIKLKTTNGEITLDGKKVTVKAENDILVQAGRWKADPVTGKSVVDTIGSMQILATKDSKIHGEEKVTIQVATGGQLQGKATKVSGFEKHGDFSEGVTT